MLSYINSSNNVHFEAVPLSSKQEFPPSPIRFCPIHRHFEMNGFPFACLAAHSPRL